MKYVEQGVVLRDTDVSKPITEILVEKTKNEMNIAAEKINERLNEENEWKQDIDGFRYRTRRKLRREV